jgi:putative hydrolase of HD superfamily
MRWSWEQRNFPISVMSHLVITTFISYILWNIENNKSDNSSKYDIFDLMIKSIYHDIPEIITWDIITPIKSATPEFRDILEKVEEEMMDDYFFIYISKDYKNEISKYMLDPFSDNHWKLAKQSDIISALLESKIERDSWNPNFNDMYTKIKRILNNSEYVSTNAFLKNTLIDFWENIWWVDLSEY